MYNVTILTASALSILVADRAENLAECQVCVFRCHQGRVEPILGGQQLAHRPDPYAHLLIPPPSL